MRDPRGDGRPCGEQRLIAFQFAADPWGAALDSPVEISVLSTFEALSCNATSATLGSAGTRFIFANFAGMAPFPGVEFPNTWYHQSLANKRAGANLNPGEPDIRARFNVNLGNPGFLTGFGWYLGLDGAHGTQIDLVTVVLHELGHGLGFSQFASLTNGSQINGFTDVYGRNLLDTKVGLTWNQMSNAQRVASAVNYGRVAWIGPHVSQEVPAILAPGSPLLSVDAPSDIAGIYPVGTATFGAPLDATGVSGDVAPALDPADVAGPSPTDACSPITNAGEVAGRNAIVDRGTCSFVVKVKNAQDAGAIAVLVADNVAGAPPPGLGGADPAITIPSVRITRDGGLRIKGRLSDGVHVSLLVDMSVRNGADAADRALIYAPNPVRSGSSISHWDTTALPNQLMEPAINGDLTHNVSGVDLTLALIRDVGWFADEDVDGVASDLDNCPAVANPDQEDLDGDGLGDLCDPDDDADGVADLDDHCPLVPPDRGLDADRDGCTDTLAGLRAILESLEVENNARLGLLAKLDEVEKDLGKMKVDSAINKLYAFIDQAAGLRTRAMDNAAALLLMTYAYNLTVLLGT